MIFLYWPFSLVFLSFIGSSKDLGWSRLRLPRFGLLPWWVENYILLVDLSIPTWFIIEIRGPFYPPEDRYRVCHKVWLYLVLMRLVLTFNSCFFSTDTISLSTYVLMIHSEMYQSPERRMKKKKSWLNVLSWPYTGVRESKTKKKCFLKLQYLPLYVYLSWFLLSPSHNYIDNGRNKREKKDYILYVGVLVLSFIGI